MIKDAVMENDFLKNLDATQVREIVESMYPREFEKGSYVIREGDAGKQQHEKNEVQKYVLVFWMEKVFSGEKNKKKTNKHWIWLDFDGYTSPKTISRAYRSVSLSAVAIYGNGYVIKSILV